ncbi:hypothetical protein M5689_000285 [Euphorbia peplus]|nr:hypothetical protein M5689_000285 [Euphorbia peplus]
MIAQNILESLVSWTEFYASILPPLTIPRKSTPIQNSNENYDVQGEGGNIAFQEDEKQVIMEEQEEEFMRQLVLVCEHHNALQIRRCSSCSTDYYDLGDNNLSYSSLTSFLNQHYSFFSPWNWNQNHDMRLKINKQKETGWCSMRIMMLKEKEGISHSKKMKNK